MKIIVAVTAASGAIYARQLLEQLVTSPQVENISLILSTNAEAVAETEGVTLPESDKITRYANDNLFAAPASGSARWDAMVIVPSSVGTVGRVAAGTSQTLIERAADVMLKERRRLVVVVRETPLSLIHLRNMTTLTEAGAIVLPASPSFYSRPTDIEELCSTVTERIVSLLGIDAPHFEWK
ncbi:MAG: UbiX family flavin prenyltransferase [Alistipes sp.]|nr:UbiX family flavin prenyltransferase [Alistipes sp.]